MSNVFNLPTIESPDEAPPTTSIANRLAHIRPATTPVVHRPNFAESDAAAAEKGFVSREARTPKPRRKKVKVTKRTLGVRVPEPDYDRFVAIADKLKVGYEDALLRLIELGETHL
jgi:hypothetical protein